MDQARPDGQRPGEPAAPATSTDQQVTEPLHALFYRRVAGDDALLQLAGLRFAQTGLAAETYADSPGELEHVLQFMPPHPRLPTVHLNRGINLLNEQSRATVMEFATRFAGRVGGLVVHDQRDMGDQTDRLLTVLRELNARLCELPDGPVRLPRVRRPPGTGLVRRAGGEAPGRGTGQRLHRHRPRWHQAGVHPVRPQPSRPEPP